MRNRGAALRDVGADRLGFRAVAEALARRQNGAKMKAIAATGPQIPGGEGYARWMASICFAGGRAVRSALAPALVRLGLSRGGDAPLSSAATLTWTVCWSVAAPGTTTVPLLASTGTRWISWAAWARAGRRRSRRGRLGSRRECRR